MFAGGEVASTSRGRRGAGGLVAALAAALWCAGLGTGHGEDAKRFGPTASPPGAKVYFVDLKDGATIGTKTVLHFGLTKMGVAPAGLDKPNTGHHHLLIDAELPPLDKPIPNDFNHLHFGVGQTEAEVTLTPGKHTLQLLLADKSHIPHNPPVMSDRITVDVSDAPKPAAAAAPPAAAAPAAAPDASPKGRKPSPAGAKVYLVYPFNGAVVAPKTTVRFGLVGMGVAPAGVEKANTGHHHLLIDADLPPLDKPIPNDFNHLHFGAGQTEAQVTLPLGRHKLQLLLADEKHVPHEPPLFSQPITVLVTATGQLPPRPVYVPRAPVKRYNTYNWNRPKAAYPYNRYYRWTPKPKR